MVEYNFTVEVKPHGKERFGINYNNKNTYNTANNKNYEKLVAKSFLKENGKMLQGGIKLGINIYYKVPTVIAGVKVNKEMREKMLNGEIEPVCKPDIDNILKSIMDGLNGIAYLDDSQVVGLLESESFFSDNPRVEVRIIGRNIYEFND